MKNNLYFFNRSDDGLIEQLNDSLKIIEISLVLAERFKIKAFYKVIAAQLRVIIADTMVDSYKGTVVNNSLITKVYDDIKLARVKENSILFDHSEHDIVKCNDLFDMNQEGIGLNEWLNQPVIHVGKGRPITIQKLIKYYANKNGGTHVDNEMPEQAIMISAIGEDYLCAIAWYVLASFKGDVDDQILQELISYEDQINEISKGV